MRNARSSRKLLKPARQPLLRRARNVVRNGGKNARNVVRSGAQPARSDAMSDAKRAMNGARSRPQGERIGVNSGTERPRPHQARRSSTNRRVDRIAVL